MSFSLSSKRWLGTVLTVTLGLVCAYADGKSEKIQFSGPGGSTNRVHSRPGEKIKFSGPEDTVDAGVADNGPSRLNSQPGAFRQAQEAILAPFVSMMQQPADSMQGVLAIPRPQPPNTQTSERARRLLDQRRNWAFSDYNDLNGADSAAAALDDSHPGAAANEDKSASLVERYYQRLGRKQPSQTRSLKDAFDSAREYATHDEDWDPSNSAFMKDKNFLKQLDTFGANAHKNKDHGTDDSTPAVNLFGDPVLTDQNAGATLAQQRRNDFQKELNPNFVPPPVKSSLNPVYSEQFARPVSLAASPAPATVRRNPLNLSNPLLADPTAVALRSPIYDNPTYTALGLPAPVVVRPQPQPMTLEKIQSMVDPMAAFKKRNF